MLTLQQVTIKSTLGFVKNLGYLLCIAWISEFWVVNHSVEFSAIFVSQHTIWLTHPNSQLLQMIFFRQVDKWNIFLCHLQMVHMCLHQACHARIIFSFTLIFSTSSPFHILILLKYEANAATLKSKVSKSHTFNTQLPREVETIVSFEVQNVYYSAVAMITKWELACTLSNEIHPSFCTDSS